MQPPFLPVYIVWVPVYRVSGAPCISDEFRRFYKGFAVLGVSTETRRVTRRNIHMSCVRSSADANQACYEVLTCDISTAGSTSTPNRTPEPPALGAENFRNRYSLHPPQDGPRKLLSYGVKTQGKTPRGISTVGSFAMLMSNIGLIVAALFLFKRSVARLDSLFGILLQPVVNALLLGDLSIFNKGQLRMCFSSGAYGPAISSGPPETSICQGPRPGRQSPHRPKKTPGRRPSAGSAHPAVRLRRQNKAIAVVALTKRWGTATRPAAEKIPAGRTPAHARFCAPATAERG